MTRVAIVDYELGNLFSVKQACLTLGADAQLTSDYKEIEKADKIILPGVGAFGEAMRNLKRLELDRVIIDAVKAGKPLMGVCLGLQLLFEESEEFGSNKGLGILPGTVKKIPKHDSAGNKLRIPQIAWNRLRFPNSELLNFSPLSTISPNSYFYFVHSYFILPELEDVKLSVTKYQEFEYCSSICKDNIFAVQFHPEKSGEQGLHIYKNWLNLPERSNGKIAN